MSDVTCSTNLSSSVSRKDEHINKWRSGTLKLQQNSKPFKMSGKGEIKVSSKMA